MASLRSFRLLRAGSPAATGWLLAAALLATDPAAAVVSAAAIEDIVDSMSVEELAELMEGEGYAVEVNNERFVQWKVDGYRCQVFVADDSQAVQFHVSFSDGNATLKKVNLWNATKRFSRTYLDEDGDPHLELDLDLAGGVTQERIVDYLRTCKVSLSTWCDEVVN
jgi:uncharacterized protein CbrC (UPF0167 family)